MEATPDAPNGPIKLEEASNGEEDSKENTSPKSSDKNLKEHKGTKIIPVNEEEKKLDPKKGKEKSDELKVPEESKVGKKLSDLTTRRVIILVLAMMFSVPFFTLTTYVEEPTSYEFGLELIRAFSDDTTTEVFNTTF